MKTKKPHFFIQQCKLDCSPEEVWRFITEKSFYRRLLPPWLKVSVVHSPHDVELGSQCHFKIHSGIAKGHWCSEVIEHKKGFLLGYRIEPASGHPWIVWIKCLPAENKGECILEDRFEFPDKGLFGGYARKMEDALRAILYYKNRTLKNDIEQLKRIKPVKKSILIAGGTGLIGSHLQRYLEFLGHEVDVLSTREGFAQAYWAPSKGMLNDEVLEGKDVVVNLSGSTIARRWSSKNKNDILDSRIASAHLLCKSISRLNHPPSVYIQTSAVGYYGFGNQVADESSPRGEGFLAEVCEKWEHETKQIKDSSTRVVVPRVGVVLTPAGGALAKMKPIFMNGFGAQLGKGRQIFPWISMNDLIILFGAIIENESYYGIVNACSPEVVDNGRFSRALAASLRKSMMPPVPGFLLKMRFGQMAEEVLLGGVEGKPEIALENGHHFFDQNLGEYLHLMAPFR